MASMHGLLEVCSSEELSALLFFLICEEFAFSLSGFTRLIDRTRHTHGCVEPPTNRHRDQLHKWGWA